MIWIIVITILCVAFFAGYEIAFVSSNKLRIELERSQNKLSARILSRFLKNPSHFIGTILVGNNIALIIYEIYMSKLMDPKLSAWIYGDKDPNSLVILLISSLIATLIILVLGEFIPKALFRINPNSWLNVLAIPFQIVFWCISPVAIFFAWLAKKILNLFLKGGIEEKKPVFSRHDLEHFVKQTQPQETQHQEINTEIFENALYLTEVKVRECMIPRTEIVMIDVSAPIEEMRNMFIQTKLSRLIVIDDEADNVLGYVHHQDLLLVPQSIKSIIKPIPAIPESMMAVDLMNLFMRERNSIAWVVDEHGGTAGLVTMEDVLEEIFGEIHDEFDAAHELVDQQLATHEYLFSGRIEIDFINDKYDLNIPTGEYETLSGYILHHHESIPTVSEVLNLDQFEITIIAGTTTKIDTVKLKVIQDI
jgi:CBS domain containing-hemolysin-like protein